MNRNNSIVYNIHNGVEIQIKTQFRADMTDRFRLNTFEYMIRVKNLNPFPVRLMARHWDIFDTYLTHRVVDGEGVVGEQPLLGENQFHQYTSYVNLAAPIGKMSGYYIFKNMIDDSQFRAEIPQFDLFHPSLYN